MSFGVIPGHPSRRVIRGHQRSSGFIRGHPNVDNETVEIAACPSFYWKQ